MQVKEQKMGQLTISAIWTLSSNVIDRLIGFISIAVLARILTPKDFGLVAMAGSVVAFADMLNAFSFDWALVRHPDPTKVHYSSAWTLRFYFGLATTIVLLIIAPITAMFFHQPALFPIISIMALSLLISTLENIGIVDFRRNFAFDREFVLRFWPKIISFIVGVGIAYIYHSFWALVIGSLTLRITGTIMSYIMHPFRPRFTLEKASELFSFSVWILAANITGFLRNCFANLFIGYNFGAKFAGMYSIANEITHLPGTEISAPILRAVFPKFAQNANQSHLLQEGFITTTSIIWMLVFPTSIGIFSISYEIVVLMLGQQWLESVTIVRLLAIGAGVNIIVGNTLYVYWALGLSKFVFGINAFTLITMIGFSIILSSPFGLSCVPIAYIIATMLVIPICYYFLWKIIGLSIVELCKRIWRTCVAAGSMLLLLKLLFPDVLINSSLESIIPLALKCSAGAGIYITVLLGLWFASGRPEGPEEFAIKTLKALFKRYTHRT